MRVFVTCSCDIAMRCLL